MGYLAKCLFLKGSLSLYPHHSPFGVKVKDDARLHLLLIQQRQTRPGGNTRHRFSLPTLSIIFPLSSTQGGIPANGLRIYEAPSGVSNLGVANGETVCPLLSESERLVSVSLVSFFLSHRILPWNPPRLF